jgi:fibronectin type 3 domain-containing protein
MADAQWIRNKKGRERDAVNRIAALVALLVLGGVSPNARVHAQATSHHTVTLSWTASADASANPSLTYNVYRSAACSQPFVQLNASPDAATTYLDAAVFAGNTYCYQVTAVLGAGESAPSNVVAAQIPAAVVAPPARTACAHRGAIVAWLRCVAAMRRSPPKEPAP